MGRNQRKKQRGMTLVEIMVVITIIGLIMGVVAIAVIDSLHEAQRKTVRLDFKQLESSLDLYHASKGHYPEPSAGLSALVDSRVIKAQPTDPWGNPYLYTLNNGQPVLTSYGSDGSVGGDGTALDLTSNP